MQQTLPPQDAAAGGPSVLAAGGASGVAPAPMLATNGSLANVTVPAGTEQAQTAPRSRLSGGIIAAAAAAAAAFVLAAACVLMLLVRKWRAVHPAPYSNDGPSRAAMTVIQPLATPPPMLAPLRIRPRTGQPPSGSSPDGSGGSGNSAEPMFQGGALLPTHTSPACTPTSQCSTDAATPGTPQKSLSKAGLASAVLALEAAAHGLVGRQGSEPVQARMPALELAPSSPSAILQPALLTRRWTWQARSALQQLQAIRLCRGCSGAEVCMGDGTALICVGSANRLSCSPCRRAA
jgi:hypothetical protein